MAEETIAASEFRDDEHRGDVIKALIAEYENTRNRIESPREEETERVIANRAARLAHINAELRRIRGEGYPDHTDRLAGRAKTTRTAG